MPERKAVTIQDIAEWANVSKSTVSRVLNNTAPVAPEKEEAVLAAVAELNYRPSSLARGLAGGRSLTIGILTQNVGSPFYDGIMRGIIKRIDHTSYSPIFADGQWQAPVELRALQTLLDRRVDGLIIVGGLLSSEKLRQVEKQVPVIVAAREIPEMSGRCVFTDNVRAAQDATRFLIESGHRRIAFIKGPATHQDARRRFEGFSRALAEAAIEQNPNLIVEGSFRRQSGVLAVESLISQSQSFSAIFAANDQMAFGARLALFRRGIRVPEDISLLGFDDEPVAAYMIPPMTTVRQPAEAMGEAAAKSILALINGESAELEVLESKLILRESVAFLR